MKRLPLSLLALCLLGCVTVQPCVCPTPAPKAEATPRPTLPYLPEFVPDVLVPRHNARPIAEPWYDGCNWHYPITATTESTTLVNCDPVSTPTPSARERP